MIHIHGGGFLESSLFPMEEYLRETSNECKIPIIGINYGYAPKHKYPEGLNDCFQAYMWILNHCEQELGIKPEKILISGDSAGGSLVLGLVLLIIAMNKFDEKKIKVSSEAKDLICKILTPNPLKRIKIDEILNHPFLKSGIQEYKKIMKPILFNQ